MKKLALLSIAIVFTMCAAVNLSAGNNLSPGSPVEEGKGSHANDMGRVLLLYIPNRIIDATDIFTMSLGAGGHGAMEVHLTRYFQLGGWHGPNYFLTKGYARQYGGGYQHGTEAGIFCFNYNETFITENFGTVKEYYIDKTDFGLATFELPAYENSAADFWEIGAHVGWLVNVSVNIHPVEIADFLTGLVFYDLMGDDI
ncbi:MAG: hypothetical protein L3J71_00965 [Victivallaceae bacterium]|nr:hypothetical protein [Victivallaceae bacterium]